jgi:hypothetical protein
MKNYLQIKIQLSYIFHRNFQNVEETARDILVNELITPRTAAFRNIQIDATSVFIKSGFNKFFA